MLQPHGPTVDSRWFKDRIADQRLSQRRLASLMGLDPAAVSLVISGKRKLSAAEAAEIARLLNVSVDEVVARSGGVTVPAKQPEMRIAQEKTPKATPVRDVLEQGMIELPVPMADGSVARLLLPRAMGKEDAQRIAAVVQALALP